MPIESATYIGSLNAANPTGADPKSDGDDHIRLIKAVVLASFSGFTGAVLVTGNDGGAPNAYTLTPPQAVAAYASRMLAVFSPGFANSGASTINISGLGAKPLRSVTGAELVGGDIVTGAVYIAVYTGSEFRLLSVTKNYIDQLVISGSVPGVTDPTNAGKVFGSTGAGGQWVALDGRGTPIINKGNSGTTAQVVNYADGEGQSITATGSFALSATGFPAGRFASILVRGYSLGAYTLTTSGIVWVKSDGTTTTTFSQAGITFPATGEAFFALFSYGDGTIYGKAA